MPGGTGSSKRARTSVPSPWRLHIRLTSAAQDELIRTNEAHGDISNMNGRTFARILLAIVIIGGAIGIGVTAYNAGVTAGLVQSAQVVVTPGGVPVAPVPPYVGYGWGYGWGGHGFGFFGFLGGLLFLFLLICLIRAAFG